MSTFLTPNRHGYSVRFSHFNPDLLVVASSQYYGLAGGGTLFFLELTPEGGIRELNSYHWSDGLFDVVSALILNSLDAQITSNQFLCRFGRNRIQMWLFLLPVTVAFNCGTPSILIYNEPIRPFRSPHRSATKNTKRKFTVWIGRGRATSS